jgi:hypothetical protein
MERIQVLSRTDDNDEDTAIGVRENVAVQTKCLGPTAEETRCSDGKRMDLKFKKRGYASSEDEKWLCSKDSHEGREIPLRMLRKCRSSDNEGMYENSALGDKGMEVPVIRVHHAQDGYEHCDEEGTILVFGISSKLIWIW